MFKHFKLKTFHRFSRIFPLRYELDQCTSTALYFLNIHIFYFSIFYLSFSLSLWVIYCKWLDFNHRCFMVWKTNRLKHCMGRRKLNNEFIKSQSNAIVLKTHRAIFTAWVVIVTSAIPAALSHGVVNYPYAGRNYTACLFLVEEGYNLVAFQVNNKKKKKWKYPFWHSLIRRKFH